MTDDQRKLWADAIAANARNHRGSRGRKRVTGTGAADGPGRIRIDPSPRSNQMTPPPFRELAGLARQRATEINRQRIAWLTAAAALDHARTIRSASEVLDSEINDPGMRELAKQLLGEIAPANH